MLSAVEDSISEIMRHLDEVTARRERLIKESREVIALSAKSIVDVHTSDLNKAQTDRKKARRKLDSLRRVAGTDLTKYLSVPEQEYVECSVMVSINTDSKIPTYKQLGVSRSSYILGLLDSIGELKRSVYNCIRDNNFKDAERMFSIMESLYAMLSPFAVYDNVVQGTKRKLDVARILVDDTRATITEEARRREFITSVNKLSNSLRESEKKWSSSH